MDPAGKELSDLPSHANTWISGADILQHIPELLVAETALEGQNEEHSIQAPFLANEVEYRQVLPPRDNALEHRVGEPTDKSAESADKPQEFKATETNEAEEESKREDAADARQSEVLDQGDLDSLPPKDFSTAEELPPAKPPRQLTAEPDIVASTKKSGPARPPPPAGIPPPRPPPPARPAPPPRKKKSDLDIEVQKIPGLEGKFQFCGNAIA